MILINKNESKKIYFNFELNDITPIYYLFKFISNDNDEVTYMMANNNSLYDNYQSFTFSEGSTQSYDGGFILNIGTYDYTIYQMATQSLNPESNNKILNSGLMQINLNESKIHNIEKNDIDYIEY